MSEPLFVGFDTSNYTTSAAVCDANGEVLLNARTLLPGGWLFGQSPPRRRFLYAVLSPGHHGGGSVRGGD